MSFVYLEDISAGAAANDDVFHLSAFPAFFPVPSLDGHIITPSQDQAQCRMYSEAPNVVWVCLESRDFLVRVVIEAAHLEVVRPSDEPILACNKLDTSYRNFCNLESPEQAACLDVIEVDGSVVETSNEPGFCWMEVTGLDPVRLCEELALDIQQH